jgi:hypothetical protein
VRDVELAEWIARPLPGAVGVQLIGASGNPPGFNVRNERMKAVQSGPPLEFSRVEQLGDRIISRINAAREHGAIWWSEKERSWIVSGHAEVAEGFQMLVQLSNDRSKLMEGMVPDDAVALRAPRVETSVRAVYSSTRLPYR